MDISANLSAMNTFAYGLGVTAHNIANVNTDDFHASRAYYQTGPGDSGAQARPLLPTDDFSSQSLPSNTDVAHEMVAMMSLENAYIANAAVIRTNDESTGTLLDLML